MHPTEKRPTTVKPADSNHDQLQDKARDLKSYLREAEKLRALATQCSIEGDLKNAYILLGNAASMALEKIPTHRDFAALLNPRQRDAVNLVSIFSIPPPFASLHYTAWPEYTGRHERNQIYSRS